jgi:hypothetical protein
VGSAEEVVETGMCQEGKKKQRKMVQENYAWRSKRRNRRRMKDPRKAGKEGSGRGSEGGTEVGTGKKEM